VLELRTTVQADTRDANHGEFDQQDVALLASGIVTWRAMDRSHRAVRECFGIELRGFYCGAVEPKTNRILANHFIFPMDDKYIA